MYVFTIEMAKALSSLYVHLTWRTETATRRGARKRSLHRGARRDRGESRGEGSIVGVDARRDVAKAVAHDAR